jgi:hypothetical protein
MREEKMLDKLDKIEQNTRKEANEEDPLKIDGK